KVLDHGEEPNAKLSRPSSPITSTKPNNSSPLHSAEITATPSSFPSSNATRPSLETCSSPRLSTQSPAQSGLRDSASPSSADRPAMGHPSCAPDSFTRQVPTPSQSTISPTYPPTENASEINANERVPRTDSYNFGFRKHDISSSREDCYQGSNVTEKDRIPLHSSIPSSMSAPYSAQDSQPYSHYDSHPSSDLRHYHQNSPNPANPMSQQYLQQNSSMQHSPSTANNPSDQSLSSSSSLLQKHRNSPFMHRDSPLSNESSQHLHPHGSPHLHHDSPHYHHHQNSPHLPINPLNYPGGRAIDSPHNHSSPLRKEPPGSQDGRYQLDFNPGHHRPPPHGMQQSPSPHRPYTDGLQIKDSPHHGIHDPQQDQYHQQQAIKGQHQGGHDYWNMHMDSLSNKLKGAGGSTKDWFDGTGNADALMSDRSSSHKSDSDHYQSYQGNSQMPPHHPMAGPDSGGHDTSPLNPSQQPRMPSQHAAACHGYSPQQQQAGGGSDQSMQGSQQPHYPNYPGHGMGGNMSPMSPGYQTSVRNPPPPHQQQPYHGGQYPGDPQQYGQMPMPQQPYSGQGCHLGPQGMGPHGPGGREGDPYSFVDEYTGPSPRPVDEVLGTQQPKRRGRKPKHIKLMENGGDPLAIAAALAAHEAKKRKKKILDPETEMLPNNLNDPLLVAAAQAAHEAKKRKMKNIGPDGKVIPTIIKPRKKMDRFDGLPEDEVAKRVLPDHLGPNLDIVIIGINPGLFAAYKGHHYAGPGNHFWKCLFLSGLIPEPLTCDDDHQLLHHGIGFTNIVARTTRGSAELTRKEIKEGGQHLLSKLQQYQPRIAVFNGKGIYEIFSGKKEFSFGRQPEKIEGTHTHVWVMPSSSARCAQLPRALDKVPFYTALRKFRDFLKGTLDELKEEDIAFANVKIRNLKKDPEKMAALAGDSILKGEAIVEDFMGSDMLRGHEMIADEMHKSLMGSDIHKPMDSAMHDGMMGREKMKSEIIGDMPAEGRDPMRREAMGGGSGGEESIRTDMMGEEGRRDMLFSGNDNI
ncbi:Uracil-DNA glycosylase-like, partial [Trinorchestia longiramus]